MLADSGAFSAATTADVDALAAALEVDEEDIRELSSYRRQSVTSSRRKLNFIFGLGKKKCDYDSSCKGNSDEPAMEAIRMVLNKAQCNDLSTCSCKNARNPATRHHGRCLKSLFYRANARKNIILVTDEGSSDPLHPKNEYSSRSEETTQTAKIIADARAFLNLIVSSSSHSAGTIQKQLGDIASDNDNSYVTKRSLISKTLQGNLQYK